MGSWEETLPHYNSPWVIPLCLGDRVAVCIWTAVRRDNHCVNLLL